MIEHQKGGCLRSASFFHATLWLSIYALVLVASVHFIIPMQTEEPGGFSALTHGVLHANNTSASGFPVWWWGWRQICQTGQIPLWNPAWFAGMPFIASRTFMPFYPFNWLAAVLPFPFAFNIQFPLHLWLAAVVMMGVLRARKFGWWAAGLGGLAWGLGGQIALLASVEQLEPLQTLAWFPLVAFGVRECVEPLTICRRFRSGTVCLATGLALQVTAGNIQILLLSVLIGTCEALAIKWKRSRSGNSDESGRLEYAISQDLDEFDSAQPALSTRTGRHWKSTLKAGIGGLLLALGFTALVWIPAAEFSKLAAGQQQATGFTQGITPDRFISHINETALILAVFALLAGGPRRRAAFGYLLLSMIALLVAFNPFKPPFDRINFQLLSPILMAYGISSAAALGAESLLAPKRPQPGGVLAWRPRVYGPLFILLALILPFLIGKGIPAGDFLLPVTFQMTALHNATITLLMGPAFVVLGLVCFFNLVWFFALSPQMKRFAYAVLLMGIPLAMACGLTWNVRSSWKAVSVAPYIQSLSQFWPLEQWEREDVPVRYYNYNDEKPGRALMLSDFRALRSVGSFDAAHPLGYRKYFELLCQLGFHTPQLNVNLLRLFAVNYLLWPSQSSSPVPPGYFEIENQGGQKLLYNPDIAYVRPILHIKAVSGWEAVLDRLTEPGFNVYESTSITEDQLPEKQHGKGGILRPLELQARVLARAPGEVQLNCHTARLGPIVISEPAVPGWRVYLNGIPARNMPQVADGFFLTVTVDSGNTRVLLQYDPISQRLGLYITCLTLGFLGIMLGRHWRVFATRTNAA